MTEILEKMYALVWGLPALVMILGVGLYLSVRSGFAQIRLFPAACRDFGHRLRRRKEDSGVSPFQALCTALAATVGTGNLAGVAGALAIGGPGAIFWMWISGILGMVTKLAEAVLSVRYRVKAGEEFLGGPMYIIRHGMGRRWAWLGALYSFFGIIAAFGVGNATQINAVITGINDCLGVFAVAPNRQRDLLMGCVLGILVLLLFLGGAKRIGSTAEKLVPFAAVGYLALGLTVLVLRYPAIPGAFARIFQGAFSPAAVTGGALGSFMGTMRCGVSRGVFTNEAGMGTAGIAHAGAQVKHPVEQGLMGIVEVFLDTIVICTMTALVILVSDVSVHYGMDPGVSLTCDGFAAVLGDWTRIVIAAELCLFAFATVLGWGLYGARCAQYLFGNRAWKLFAAVQAITVVIAAVLQTQTVWLLSEIVNGLMAIPNLIAMAALSPEFCRLLIEYQKNPGDDAGGGITCKFPSTPTAANPHPCGNSTPLRWRRKSRGRKFTT